jgi:hypothetical protein
MAVYRGVVKNKAVVFEEPVDLADGVEVEVHIVDDDAVSGGGQERETAFLQHLLAIGMIGSIPPRLPDPPGLDRTPLKVDGPPVSQTLIEERR